MSEDILANAKAGMEVKVSGTVRGRTWNDKVFVNIRAASVEYVGGAEEQAVEDFNDAF